MKINDINRLGAVNPYQSAKNQRTESNARRSQKDELHISSEAMEMLSQAQVNSPERAKKIEQLKEAVSTGTYQVDAGKVAEKMLPFLLP
ncbi:flagellar biosynthesis anti-sigma factor FlgM [Cohnella pontilimi]|uniref:Negative regulator of flagellin synthesis n=1 Tax=Cohnella pontilimi TaxID=2564100 RepID=A0A4U0FAZ8_9BACL|nr:flagellar biosynthesis anti-sigma factor FlgM [Cohnella pontilimi]TJY41945.1 flagellar biosynthesis anti-sigma factor FlgM [Cohnella pontilimi]